MFYQIFLSPQVKRIVINSNKNGIQVASRVAKRLKILDLDLFGDLDMFVEFISIFFEQRIC